MGSIDFAVAQLLQCQPDQLSITSVGGGCVSEALRVECFKAGHAAETWFVKSNDESAAEMFRVESRSLAVLGDVARQVDGLVVPDATQVAVVESRSFLAMPWIDRATWTHASDIRFGQVLAKLHRATLGRGIGWNEDTYLGTSLQPNSPAGWDGSWSDFVAEHRIGYQLRLALDHGYRDRRLEANGHEVISRMAQILAGRDDSTSLLHGDLWSGNFWTDRGRQIVIIDPAVYRGCREAELGMLKLFGARSDPFYDAYDDAFSLPDGWQRRVEVYVLYHLLNHLNLFGSSYLSQCQSCLRKILAA